MFISRALLCIASTLNLTQLWWKVSRTCEFRDLKTHLKIRDLYMHTTKKAYI